MSRFRTLSVCGILALLGISFLAWKQYRSWTRSQYEAACRAARNDVNWQAELATATQWTNEFPEDVAAWLYLSEACMETEQFERAREGLQHVPPTDSRYIPSMIQMAALEWNELRRPRDAIATYRKLLTVDPHILEAHAHIIAFHAFLMERMEMLAAIDTAIKAGAEPRDAYAYLCLADRINVSNGRQILQRWMRPDENDVGLKISFAVRTAEQIAMTADMEVEMKAEKQEQEAIFRLEEFLKEHPHHPVLLSFLLDHYVEKASVADVSRLLALVPESAAADHKFWVDRGWYYTITEQYPEAESSFRRALQLHPLSAEARHHYSTLMRLMKRPDNEVQQMQSLAAEGREIRKQVLQLKASDSIDEPLLRKLAAYAEHCGDMRVQQALAARLGERSQDSPETP